MYDKLNDCSNRLAQFAVEIADIVGFIDGDPSLNIEADCIKDSCSEMLDDAAKALHEAEELIVEAGGKIAMVHNLELASIARSSPAAKSV